MNFALLNHLINDGKYTFKTYSAQEIIVDEFCFKNELYLIHHGIVKICRDCPRGYETISILLSDGMIFGANVLCKDSKTYCTAETLCDTEIYSFHIRDIEVLLKSSPRYAIDFLQIMKEKYQQTERRIRILNMRSAEQRFIETIIEFIQKFSYQCPKTGDQIIKLPFDQNNFGKYIRTTRVTVCFLINLFKNYGVLDFQQGLIVIPKQNLHYFESRFRLSSITLKQKVLI